VEWKGLETGRKGATSQARRGVGFTLRMTVSHQRLLRRECLTGPGLEVTGIHLCYRWGARLKGTSHLSLVKIIQGAKYRINNDWIKKAEYIYTME
jgi:hypothetical protein